MKSNYKPLGRYIREVNNRDKDLSVDLLLGVSIQKKFIPSIANIIGTDMSTYKIIKKNQFAYGPVTSRNGDKISIALLENYDEAIISQAYTCFKIIDYNELLPEYLMMWFRRPEFDRYARFMSHGSAREIFGWEEMCNTKLPIPSIEKQREIVAEYNTVQKRITLNNSLIQKLEATAQALYKHWFVAFEFPNEEGKPYKSSGGEMVQSELGDIPKGWDAIKLGGMVQTQYGFTASAEFKNVGPKLVRITDIAQSQINWNSVPYCEVPSKELKKYLLNCGDIVIARTGATAGYAKRINKNHPKAVFASYLVRMVPTEKPMNIYLGLSIDSSTYRDFILANAEGSAQPQANATLMSEFPIIKPGFEVLSNFNKYLEPIIDHIELTQMQNSKIESLVNILHSKLATIETTKPELAIA